MSAETIFLRQRDVALREVSTLRAQLAEARHEAGALRLERDQLEEAAVDWQDAQEDAQQCCDGLWKKLAQVEQIAGWLADELRFQDAKDSLPCLTTKGREALAKYDAYQQRKSAPELHHD